MDRPNYLVQNKDSRWGDLCEGCKDGYYNRLWRDSLTDKVSKLFTSVVSDGIVVFLASESQHFEI